MADNHDTINDENGDASGLDRDSQCRHDDREPERLVPDGPTGQPGQVAFSQCFLAPDEYLLLFASGRTGAICWRDCTPTSNSIKAAVILGSLDSGTNVISEFSLVYPAQQKDISYGAPRVRPTSWATFPSRHPVRRIQPAVPVSRRKWSFHVPAALSRRIFPRVEHRVVERRDLLHSTAAP
jgi:hypothetical protein